MAAEKPPSVVAIAERDHGSVIAARLGKRQRWLVSADLPQPGKVKGKRGVCRWCLGKLPGRRTSWCSNACSHEFNIRSSGGVVRHLVEERDGGVCAACGLDTHALVKWWRRQPVRKPSPYASRQRRWFHAPDCRVTTCSCRWCTVRGDLIRRGFDTGHGWRNDLQALWEADHVIPVSEGGGCCGLENYETLCTPCHKAKTKRMHAEQSAARRDERRSAKPLPLFDGESVRRQDASSEESVAG